MRASTRIRIGALYRYLIHGVSEFNARVIAINLVDSIKPDILRVFLKFEPCQMIAELEAALFQIRQPGLHVCI